MSRADGSSSAISLLLVEEDERSAERLFEFLSRPEGTRFEITLVPHIEDALGRLRETSFDVMLIDLSIHEGYGLDSLLRARVATRSVPVVLLTYHRDEALALKAARAGAQDYLTRGEVSPDLLARTLIHAVERHRITRELTEAQKKQHFLATHDALTKLPNRYAFLEQLSHSVADAQRNKTRLATLFFDLDGFKSVNDNRGHGVGDELLTDVAQRVRRAIRKSDAVARIGGDEFVASIRNVTDIDDVVAVAQKIREEIEKPYHIQNEECWISASIGIATYPDHAQDPDELIRCADTAMYQAKSTGKNQVRVFESQMNDKAVQRFEMVNGLREAIHSGNLKLVFQPQVHVDTGELVAAEALVRWNDSRLGEVSPGEFIALAEDSGVIDPLGEWVLRTACEAAASWSQLPDLRIAVNISGRQLEQPNFPERVMSILAETGLSPRRLELELTESLAASERAIQAMATLRERGVRVAIDDFGTGFSSLTLLKDLPVDTLKLDQSFVRGATSRAADAVILEAVIRMAQGLGVDLLAEGVETVEEMDWLRQRGCSLMQGYLFSKPIAKLDFEPTVTAHDAFWRAPMENASSWAIPEPIPAQSDEGDADLPGIRSQD